MEQPVLQATLFPYNAREATIFSAKIAADLERARLKPYRISVNLRKPGRSILLGLAIISLAVSSTAALQLSREQADSMARKIDEITGNAANQSVQPKRTQLAELEANSYLLFNLKEKIPPGLASPQISMLGNGALAGRVLVDIDEFKRHRGARGIIDPLSYISGQVPVTARGVLRTQDGRGQFYLGSAEIRGFPLPKPILRELVSYFSRTPEYPNGFNIDEPFNLPAKIRQVVVNRGEAVVAQ
jgi:hypothetical protein